MSRTTHHGARKLTDATRTPKPAPRRTGTRRAVIAAHLAGRI